MANVVGRGRRQMDAFASAAVLAQFRDHAMAHRRSSAFAARGRKRPASGR